MNQASVSPPKNQRSSSSNLFDSVQKWLEGKYCAPSFAGYILLGISFSFFGVGVNTMSGWAYIISGMIIALIFISAFLCVRNLKKLEIERLAIHPVSVEQELSVELIFNNTTDQFKQFFQMADLLPTAMTQTEKPKLETWATIREIKPQSQYHYPYSVTVKQRGIYHWDEIILRSGNPIGLCWCRRTHHVPARAIIYPMILNLTQCPIIDTLGKDESWQQESDRTLQAAQEGITKALRPYRFGDPTRLIHWRTSARFNEFKVRELEIITGGKDIVIALDTTDTWKAKDFEKAVTVAASLYTYATKSQMNVKLWVDNIGLVSGVQRVLEALAAVEADEETITLPSVGATLIWLTQNPNTINSLPNHSHWLFFANEEVTCPKTTNSSPGIILNCQNPAEIRQQLQSSVAQQVTV